jgi:hypothetical protein
MGVVDGDAVPVVVEVVRRQQALRVDLVAVGRVAQVLRTEDLADTAVLEAHVAAALVRRVSLRVSDDVVELSLRDLHPRQG